ncbi:hypothetical protein E4U10_000710, partial [Claviceps purpurea]
NDIRSRITHKTTEPFRMSSRLGQAAPWANLWRKPIPNALSRSTGSPRNSRWPYSSPVRRFAWPCKPLLGRLNSAWR